MRNELNNKKRFVWRCAVVLLALVCFGIWFVNQPKEDEVSTKRIVINERPKQEVKKRNYCFENRTRRTRAGGFTSYEKESY